MIWRTGRKVGRTLYAQQTLEPQDGDQLIGVMDTPELAERVVLAVNDGHTDFIADDIEFGKELQRLLNRHNIDAALNIPDFILADHLIDTLWYLKKLMAARDNWGRLHIDEAEPDAG